MEPRSYTAIRNHLAEAEETRHLMRSPVNAERLNRAIAQLEAGKGKRLPLLLAHQSGPTERGKTTSGGRKKTRRYSRASTR